MQRERKFVQRIGFIKKREEEEGKKGGKKIYGLEIRPCTVRDRSA